MRCTRASAYAREIGYSFIYPYPPNNCRQPSTTRHWASVVASLAGDRDAAEDFFRKAADAASWWMAPAVLLHRLARLDGRREDAAHWAKLAIDRRLDGTGGSLLKQAALIRYGDGYWLAANDADLQLDGEPFPPNAATMVGVQGLAMDGMLVEVSAVAMLE